MRLANEDLGMAVLSQSLWLSQMPTSGFHHSETFSRQCPGRGRLSPQVPKVVNDDTTVGLAPSILYGLSIIYLYSRPWCSQTCPNATYEDPPLTLHMVLQEHPPGCCQCSSGYFGFFEFEKTNKKHHTEQLILIPQRFFAETRADRGTNAV